MLHFVKYFFCVLSGLGRWALFLFFANTYNGLHEFILHTLDKSHLIVVYNCLLDLIGVFLGNSCVRENCAQDNCFHPFKQS